MLGKGLNTGYVKSDLRYFYSTVKLLLNDQWRNLQKAVAEVKRSPNATKVRHIKQSDSIYYTFITLLPSTKSYVVGTHLNRLMEMIQMSTKNIATTWDYLETRVDISSGQCLQLQSDYEL